ncbi:hypothetical protein [Methylobacterium organophilum]|uniref:Histidine kinase n=1 Tax=Methylobacterium organophilum TaxID=410 RepID=A0ABQ4TBK3_METOR|nr:hypothetical protein [Methylobacterium organophilum]GJE28250.1 hypothetical protein LKMONMHP_3117 [Methylobacterium organophilum]
MSRPPGLARMPRRSLFRSSAFTRLIAAFVLSGLLWAAILWALA